MDLTYELKEQMKAHAVEQYPLEACGIVAGGVYVPQYNTAADPRSDFALPARTFADYDVEAVFHSHPDAEAAPTEADMKSQIETAVPWILCESYSDHATDPFMWGGSYIPPLIGRTFRHGPSGTDDAGDCYALIKDWYKLEQGVELPEFPRSNEWWKRGGHLYIDNLKAAGFCIVQVGNEPQIGDVALMAINSKEINHAAIYIGNGLILQHLTNRLSRRDPAALWAKQIKMWVARDA